MQQFEVRMLGPLEVVGPQGPVALGGPTNRAVLAVLAINRGRSVSAAFLLDAAWAGEPPPSGVRALHSVVSRLRAGLGGAGIEAAGAGYKLQAATVDADVVVAEVERARVCAEEGDRAAAGELLVRTNKVPGVS